jgi:hypothetical protein
VPSNNRALAFGLDEIEANELKATGYHALQQFKARHRRRDLNRHEPELFCPDEGRFISACVLASCR